MLRVRDQEPGSQSEIAVALVPSASSPLPESKPTNCRELDFLQETLDYGVGTGHGRAVISHSLINHQNPLLYGCNQIQYLENDYTSSPKPYKSVLNYVEL